MTTLAHLRALLERAFTHADNPAILCLPEGERTVEGVARAALPVFVAVRLHDSRGECAVRLTRLFAGAITLGQRDHLDLTDPGTVHAVKVALALALGLDPGVMGTCCMWDRSAGPGYARWILLAATRHDELDRVLFESVGDDDDSLTTVKVLAAPAVAAEPNPIRALVLAVAHVLEAK